MNTMGEERDAEVASDEHEGAGGDVPAGDSFPGGVPDAGDIGADASVEGDAALLDAGRGLIAEGDPADDPLAGSDVSDADVPGEPVPEEPDGTRSVAQERRAELRRQKGRRGPLEKPGGRSVPITGRGAELPRRSADDIDREAEQVLGGGPIPTVGPMRSEAEQAAVERERERGRDRRRGGPNSFGYDPDLWPPEW